MRTAIFVFATASLLWGQNIDTLLGDVAKWQADTDRKPTLALAQFVQKASPTQRRDIEQKFIAFLKSDATPGGKDFVCKQLSSMGSEASVPALVAMLGDPKTADVGRYALERIPGAAVDRALRETLPKSSGRVRIGIVNTIGVRRDPGAVSALRSIALGAQADEASAALDALAHIADSAAASAIGEVYAKNPRAAAETYLQAANRMAERGNASAAALIYQKLYASAEPPAVKAAALRQMRDTGTLMQALHGSDLQLQAVAIYAMMPKQSVQLIAEMPKLSEAAQIRMLGLLSERGDTQALPAFTAAMKSTSKPVRVAALQSVGTVGNASVVPALAAAAAGPDAEEQAAARAGLTRVKGADADRAIAEAIVSAAPNVKRELIRAAGERGANAAAPELLKTARDSDNDVRRDSLRALASVAGSAEVTGLVALVANPAQPDDRAEASKSLGAALRRADASSVQEVVTAYNGNSNADVRAALLGVLGQSASAPALTALRGALKDPNDDVKRAAIVALGEWSDTTPLPDLFDTARSATSPSHQVLAVRSAIKLIGISAPGRPHAESAKLAAEALSLAKDPAEKRAILALLPRYPVKESLDIAKALADDPQVGMEAKAAAMRLERTVRR
jgi:HEAT repeat protein